MLMSNFPPSVKAPVVMEESVSAFSAAISWINSGPVVDRYEVYWERDASGECPNEKQGNTVTDGSTTSYEITDLFGVSRYNVTVMATNAAGTAVSNEFFITTPEAGSTNSLCVAPCS